MVATLTSGRVWGPPPATLQDPWADEEVGSMGAGSAAAATPRPVWDPSPLHEVKGGDVLIG